MSALLSEVKVASARASLAEAGVGDLVEVLPRDPANGYVSVGFPDGDGMEISCYSTSQRPD